MTVMYTPHCTSSTSSAGMISERNVNTTTRKIDTAVSIVISSSSLWKLFSIS